jgi:hypothetical protein
MSLRLMKISAYIPGTSAQFSFELGCELFFFHQALTATIPRRKRSFESGNSC